MANDILKNDPQADIDDELNHLADDIVGKPKKSEFATVKYCIDSMIFNTSVWYGDRIEGLQHSIIKLNRMINNKVYP